MRAIQGLKKRGVLHVVKQLRPVNKQGLILAPLGPKLGLSFGVREALGAWDPLFALGKA